MATVDANEAGKAPPWSGLRAESLEAYQAGRIFDAYDLLRRAVVVDALRWFEEEGVKFVQPDREHTTNELLRGMALAARGVVEERGESVTYKLLVAANTLEAVAAIATSLEQSPPDDPTGFAGALLGLFFIGVDVGRSDAIMVLGEAGVMTAFERFQQDRERRRFGARIVNGRKATTKERALGEALKVTSVNRTLSNEDLAELVRRNLDLITTIRTVTDWVREWRRAGTVPPRSPGLR